MRLIAYTRVSGDSQKDNTSLPVQLDRIKAYALAAGHEIVYIYSDVETASGKRKRPGFERLLAALREHCADGLICTKLDRFARSTMEGLQTAKELDKIAKHLVILDLCLDTSSAVGNCVFTILLAFAELERNIIGERMQSGRDRVKDKGGRAHGRTPYGFTTERIDGVMRLVPAEDFQWREKILYWYEYEGWTIARITAELERLGVKPRFASKWSHQTVRLIVWRAGKLVSRRKSKTG